MSQVEWAENEVRIAVEREAKECRESGHPEDIGYAVSCYDSALKAYKSLMEDGHSGMSYSIVSDILNKLMKGKPLTPITEQDFDGVGLIQTPKEALEEMGLKSEEQCKRMSSLFKQEFIDGKVTYSDVDRVIFKNTESGLTYCVGRARKIIDEKYPITLPYGGERYTVEGIDFLTDAENGDFDTMGFYRVKMPNGQYEEINKFYGEDESGKMVEISQEEFEQRKARRIK